MASVTVSASYQNGSSFITIPAEFNPDNLYLLMNGQVWAGDNLSIAGDTLTVFGVDLTDEVIQLSDFNGISSDPAVSGALGDILNLLSEPGRVTLPTGNLAAIAAAKSTDKVLNPKNQFTQRKGMNADTGQVLEGIEHLKQSLRNLIMTPRWQRVMRRTYGCDVYEKVDYPGNSKNVLIIYSQVADAIEEWEPRFALEKINASVSEDGKFTFSFLGDFLGKNIQFGGLVA